MTKREAAIVSAYTGILIGRFDDMQRYVDEKIGRPTWTHEYGSEEFAQEIKRLTKQDFMDIEVI